jgi:putative pantetheine hydrolase
VNARPGPFNALTDVEGIEVGHCTRAEAPWLSGTTAIVVRGGAVAACDVRGAAPATRETDVLRPGNLVEEVHAIVLSGGSAFGLVAADGVMRFLEEQGIGRAVGSRPGEVVPIVPAAALFDLGRGGDFAARPDATCGYRAAAAAAAGALEQGNVGAGTGALFGGRRLKGGIGTASAVTPEGTVAALVALNAVGSAVDPASGQLWGSGFALDGEFGALGRASPGELASFAASPLADTDGATGFAGATGAAARATGAAGATGAAAPDTDPSRIALGPEGAVRPTAPVSSNAEATLAAPAAAHTVIGVVATDVSLSRGEAQRLACVAHDGLARAVRPSHTLFDGDVFFALATGRRSLAGSGDHPARDGSPGEGHSLRRGAALVALCELAADCVTRSVVHAVLSARSVGTFTAYRDAFPSAVATLGR